jgi:hypothetical protein
MLEVYSSPITRESHMSEDVYTLPVDELEQETAEYCRHVAVYLRMERERLGLEQGVVAKRCGRSPGWASQLESGKNDSHSAAKKYALAMGVDFALIVSLAEAAVDTRRGR